MPEDRMASMSAGLCQQMKQQLEDATKVYEYHQSLMNDARMVLDVCRAAIEHLKEDIPQESLQKGYPNPNHMENPF